MNDLAAASRISSCTLDELTAGQPILVLAPHPDDESLACGGLLAASFEATGAHVACVTDGRFSHPGSREWPPERLAALRYREVLAAIRALGGGHLDLTFLGYHDCHAPHDPYDIDRAARRLARLCRRRGIATLFAPAPEDPHKDHGAVARLARATVDLVPEVRLFDYSVWARWHGLQLAGGAQVHFEAGRWCARKARAIACHRSQLGEVVDDDPQGFVMSKDFVGFFVESPEWFRRVR